MHMRKMMIRLLCVCSPPVLSTEEISVYLFPPFAISTWFTERSFPFPDWHSYLSLPRSPQPEHIILISLMLDLEGEKLGTNAPVDSPSRV